VARDHFGVKPLFYFQNSEAVGFSSEVSALQKLLPSSIDPVALRQFLFYEYIPAPRTIYQNIFKLEPGCFLRAKDGKTEIRSYATPRPFDRLRDREARLSQQETQKQLEAQLSKSIQMQLVSDVPIGVFLSGGIDSSLIAYYAAQHQPGIQTFSIAFEDPSYDESPYFKMVSQTLNIKSHVQTLKSSDILDIVSKVIPQLDEPLGDPSILPTYLLSQFARQHVTVALSGDGADELFGGYPTYLAHRLTAPYAALPRAVRHGIANMIGKLPVSHKNISWDFKLKRFVSGFDYPAAIQHQIWMGGISPQMLQQILPPSDQLSLFEPLTQKTFKDFMDQDFRMYLQDDLLVKTDRASMLNSLEVRVPFLDPDLVAMAYNLPASSKLRGTTSKYILRKLLKEKFPSAITSRPKKGFGIPVSKWLQHELKDVLMAQIEFLGNQNLGFNTDKLKNMAQQHFDNRVNYRKELWQVLVLGVWLAGHRD
jgi:asparagine synthase (glutamine-hydrolysing)